nr:hypothetical protein Iba_chr02cCG8520 [Ipomoea batatas]
MPPRSSVAVDEGRTSPLPKSQQPPSHTAVGGRTLVRTAQSSSSRLFCSSQRGRGDHRRALLSPLRNVSGELRVLPVAELRGGETSVAAAREVAVGRRRKLIQTLCLGLPGSALAAVAMV